MLQTCLCVSVDMSVSLRMILNVRVNVDYGATLRYSAVHSVLQCVAVYYSVLPCVVVCCSVL